MSPSPQVFLAKSSGVTLEEHNRHLSEQFDEHIYPSHVLACGVNCPSKYTLMTGGEDLGRLTRLSIRWHDTGKKNSRWQLACQADYREYKQWELGGRIGPKPRGKNLRQVGVRHEFDSLRRLLVNEPNAHTVIQAAVAAHHGKLSMQHQKRWHDEEAFFPLLRRLNGIGDSFVQHEWQDAIKHRYLYDGPRALLQLADHRASASEDNSPVLSFTKFHYQFRHPSRRGPQKSIGELWDDPVALLRAATGAGKTDAAFLWAQHQIENNRADRLVIAMPTRFTANAVAVSNADSLSRVGLYHSTALYQQITDSTSRSEEKWLDAESEMARLLETPITVTTLDHLCISLTATREDHHAIYFNLAHSCVVIDEADFYDAFTQANLVILLQALRTLNVPVLIMSATLPESSKEMYGVAKIYEDITDYDKPRCNIQSSNRVMERPQDIQDLLQPIFEGRPAIIYANTVKRAQRIYRWLRKQMPSREVVLYHSRYTESDKIKIEKRLSTMLGKEAWKSGKQHGVAVLTQIGELSVNISADYMISDLCPLDRLVQRAGRLSRFPESQSPGELHVVIPYKKNKAGESERYPAPYGAYRNGWEAYPALVETEEMIQNPRVYSARNFVDFVNVLYASMPEMPKDAEENQRQFKRLIAANWLVRQSNEIPDDAEETNEWRSRNIPFQHIVLVDGKPSNLIADFDESENYTWKKWRRLQLKYGVTCHKYEFDRAVQQGLLEKIIITIGESGGAVEQEAFFVRPGCYDDEEGLRFEDPEDED